MYAALGVVVATISSMAGIGGGVFMVPLFSLFAGLPIHKAVGTSKAVIVVISLISAISYIRHGRVNFRIGTILLATTVPGSYLGAYLVSLINPRILEVVVASFIILYSTRLLWKGLKGNGSTSRNNRKTGETSTGILVITTAAGLAIGLIAGLTGTGGGALMVPLMVAVLGVSIHEAVATSMYAMSLAAVAAGVRHYLNGDIVPEIAVPFGVGAVVGSMLGPRIAVRLKARQLRLVVGVILVIVGVRMLLG